MRTAYAHDAVVDMEPDADLHGPGGAITLELCGAFEHPPPCPVAPHATRADRRDSDVDTAVAVRVLFAVEPAGEAAVRTRIDHALATGSCEGPDGTRSRWTLRSSGPGTVAAAEGAHAARLAAT